MDYKQRRRVNWNSLRRQLQALKRGTPKRKRMKRQNVRRRWPWG